MQSLKYPEVSCYGVIVSASCDLANNKIGKVYYLTAVSAFEWLLTEVGFNIVFKNRIKTLTQQVESEAQNNNLCFETIIKFSDDDVKKIFRKIRSKKARDKITKLYEDYVIISDKCNDFNGRREIVCSYKSDALKFWLNHKSCGIVHF